MIILSTGAHIGRTLQHMRIEAGLTQDALGERLRCTRLVVSKRERRPNIAVDTLVEHVAALGHGVALPAAGDPRPRYRTDEFALEYQLLRAEGYSRQHIADRLGITRHAVDQAYLRAVKAGLLTPDRRTA